MQRYQFATFWALPAALLAGMAFAGAVTEVLGMLTRQRPGFGLLFRGGRKGLLALPLLIFTGPAIVMRALVRFLLTGRTGRALLVAGGLLAVGWAVASGHLLLRIVGLLSGR